MAAFGLLFLGGADFGERPKNLLEIIFANRFVGRYTSKIDFKAVFSHFIRKVLYFIVSLQNVRIRPI